MERSAKFCRLSVPKAGIMVDTAADLQHRTSEMP